MTHSVPEVAQQLRVSGRTVFEWIRRGELRAVNVSRNRGSRKPRLRIIDSDLEAFLASRSVGTEQREHCLWQLARTLKGLPETRHLRVDDLESLVHHWWQLALPKVKKKEWFLTWACFARCWSRVMVPLGEGGLGMGEILERARRAGCPDALKARYGSDVCGLVAAICRELSQESEDGEFFLDCRALGRLCGISWSKASSCLRALVASRVIRKIGDPAPGQATVYLYLLRGGDA